MADGRVVIEIELNDGKVVKGIANVDKQLKSLGNTSADPKLNLDDKQFQKSMNTAMTDTKALDNSTASVFLNADNKMTPILDNAKLDLKGLDGSVSQAVLEMNGAEFEKVVEQAKIDATTLNKTTAQVMLSADDKQFKPKIETANFDIKGLDGVTAQTNLEMNVFEFQKAVDQARIETAGLDGTVSQVTLSANDKNFLPPVENAKIEIKELDGTEAEATITADTKPLETSVDAAKAKLKEVDDQTKQVEESSKKTNLGFMDFAKGAGAIKLVEMGMTAVVSSMDSAISRFDTMQGYPKMMEALGYSADDSSDSIKRLGDGIDGLPTKLDSVVATSQRMTVMTGNLNKSTDATLALNNAFLANRSSSDAAARGTEQYLKMLATGEVNMTSWNSLQETMGLALNKTAEEMGFAGEAIDQQLYAALQDGEVTFQEFTNGLIAVGTGTGEVAELAKINSEGIATSFSNLTNAIGKGVGNTIDKLNELTKEVTGKNIAQNLDGLKVIVNSTFDAIGKAILATTPLVIVLADAFGFLMKAINLLIPTIAGLTAAFVALKVIEKTNQLIEHHKKLIDLANESQKLITLSLKAKTAAEVAGETATKAATLAEMAKNGQLTISTALVGLLTGAMTLQEFTLYAVATATKVLDVALKTLAGPIGWVIVGITALVGTATALFKWFNKDTEATKNLKKEQQELTDATDKLTEASKQNAINRKESIDNVISSSRANGDLIDSVVNLSKQEKLSAGHKKILNEQIEQLNSAYEGLNLQYSEETGNLSMSAQALHAKAEAYQENAKMIAAQEQLVEIAKEQNEVDMKLEGIAELREKYNEQLNGSWKESRQAKKGLEELDDQEEVLIETTANLGKEQANTAHILEESAERSAIATKEAAELMVVTYENLTDKQKEAVDRLSTEYDNLYQAATDAFSKINTESEISLAEMNENLIHNEKAVKDWGENQAALLAWAGENGYNSFIPFIENMTISQAGELAEMAKGLDNSNVEQAALLENIAQTYERMGGSTGKAYKTAMGDNLNDIPDAIINDKIMAPVISKNADINLAFAKSVEGVGDSMTGEIEKAKPQLEKAGEDNGQAVVDGTTKGIDNALPGLKTSAEDMSKTPGDIFKTQNLIHSPSKLFEGFGRFIGQGLTGGMDSQRGNVRSSSDDLASNVKIGFNTIESEMYSIGQNAMIGLNNGMVANAGIVYSSAQTIANNVKNIIQSAMDIHSPSRWMKNFIGKNMMQGWADGLDQYAKLPIRSMESAADDLKLPVLHAENFVGIHDATRGTSNISNNRTITNNNTRNFEGLFKGATFNWSGKEDIRKTMQEIAWMTQIEGADMNA